jgi:hypothetical protein
MSVNLNLARFGAKLFRPKIMGTTQQYKLRIEERDRYVFACVESKMRPAPRRDPTYLERIADHCARCRCTSILIEKHTDEVFNVWDAFAVAPKLASIGHDEIKIALVEKCAVLPARDHLTVAIGPHRGLSVHIFRNTSAAEEWLMKASGPSGPPEMLHISSH